MKNLSKTVITIILVTSIAIDQISKIIVRQNLSIYENIQLVKNYFILTRVENTGAFLSAGNNLPQFARIILLTILPIVVLLYGCFILYKKTNLPRLSQIGIALLVGGGIGNIIDRVAFGAVTDFLFTDFVIFKTGVYNIADMCIMAGIGFMLFDSFFQRKNN